MSRARTTSTSTAGWPFRWMQRAWDRLPWPAQVVVGPLLALAPLVALVAVPLACDPITGWLLGA